MQVASGGLQFRMTEQNLNVAEIHAGFEQVSGKGVPEQMRMNRLGDAGEFGGVLASQNNGIAGEGSARFLTGEQPVLWPLPAKVATEQFQQFRRQKGLPVLAPFAATNPNHMAAAIDVGHFEVRYLGDSRTGSIHSGSESSGGRGSWVSPGAL